jgi:ribonuclease T1
VRAVKLVTIALAFALSIIAAAGGAASRTGERELRDVATAELPREARDVLALIKRGGPFRHRQDGSVFGNREKRLPLREQGYYREYTVPTPGASDRGARRIVAGAGSGGDAKSSSEYYYSDDHYKSFRRIRE